MISSKSKPLPNPLVGDFIVTHSKEVRKEEQIQKILQKLWKKHPDRNKILKPMLDMEKGNTERLVHYLKRLKNLKKTLQLDHQSIIVAFITLLESECKSIHDAAILSALYGKASFLKSVIELYPGLMESKYAKQLQYLNKEEKSEIKKEKSGIKKERIAIDPRLKPSEDHFGEVDIFLSLEELGIFKDSVSVLDCLDSSSVAKGLNELTEDINTSIFVVHGKKFPYSYLTIVSWKRVVIFDLSQMNAVNPDLSLEQIRLKKCSAFMQLFKKFLMNGDVVKYLVNSGGFKKFLKRVIGVKKLELQDYRNFIDRQMTFFDLLQEPNREEKLELKGLKKKIDGKFYEYVEAVFSRPFSHAAEYSDWDQRPATNYQQHYMALAAYILLPIYQKLDSERIGYRQFKTLQDLQVQLAKIKRNAVIVSKKFMI